MSVWQEVGDGCFRRRYDSFDLNIGVVRGVDALCVFDTRCHAVEADELLDELTELGRSRVRWVVNSHWHFDHTFGNARLLERHPGVEIWGSRAMRDELLELGELSRVEWQRRKPEWTEPLGEVEIVPPEHVFEESAAIDLGDRQVELRRFGRGHTAGDIVAFVSDADVAYVGDVVEEGAPPGFNQDSYPLEWPASNTSLLERIGTDTVVIPGHGDIVDRTFVSEQRDALGRVASMITALHEAGTPVDDALLVADGWPFPPAALHWAIRRGYEALGAATPDTP